MPENPTRKAPHCIGVILGGIPAQGDERPIAPPGVRPQALHGFGGELFYPRNSSSPNPPTLSPNMEQGVPDVHPAGTKRGTETRAASWSRN